VSSRSVATLVTDAIDNNSESSGLAHPPTVKCSASGARCNVQYTLKQTVGLNGPIGALEVGPTAQIWKGLFEDSRFKSGVIAAFGRPIHGAEPEMFTVKCNRNDAGQINWDHVDAHRIESTCTLTQYGTL
jgi:hypothetical protein